ncbi:MAG TPA: ribokinase, partial [Pasteurellaceae bacterium]|nr:ribokinase [Pasteurellaceae bacterium]
MKNKVCVFGSYNIDIAIKVPYMPIVGESLIGSESYIGPGGKGINQAIAASYAGASLYYIGKIGNDNFSTLAREYLHKIDIVGLKLFVSEEKPTGKALILVSNKENAENLIAVDPGANFTITQEEIETILPILSKCNILFKKKFF